MPEITLNVLKKELVSIDIIKNVKSTITLILFVHIILLMCNEQILPKSTDKIVAKSNLVFRTYIN